jgi:hypothetical protein
MSLLNELETNAKKTLEDLGTHEPMIYMNKNGTLVSYFLVFNPATKGQALKHFREMVTNEKIPIYWTVTESWVSKTAGLRPEDDLNRKEMLIISEYNGETMENRKILVPFERKFDDEELLAMSERIREKFKNLGTELPQLELNDLKDPIIMKTIRMYGWENDWAGKIIWGPKEAFSIGLDSGDAKWIDRWDFYREDISGEMEEKFEKRRIEHMVQEVKELDLTDFMKFANEVRNQLVDRGIEMPPIPPEDEIRQILIHMAESGCLIKLEESVDIHEMVKDINDADPNIPASQIHAMGDE